MATKTTFDGLHTDIILCIFDYFTVNEIYETFSELITNLTSLLIDSHIRLHLRQSMITEIDGRQVISMDFNKLPQKSCMSNFINLRSLVLHDMENPKILINQSLSQSLEILYLNISLRYKPDIIPPLLHLLTKLPKLKSYTLIYSSSYFILQEDLLINPTSSTSIENLKLDIKCTIACLEKLFKCLPYLRRFQANIVIANPEDSLDLTENLVFPSIQNLFLTWDYIPFQDVINLCKKIPNLKQCEFIANDHNYDQNVFNPLIWRQFIENDHVLLQKLVVNIQTRPRADRYRIGRTAETATYFTSINFKLELNHWGDKILIGNYMRQY